MRVGVVTDWAVNGALPTSLRDPATPGLGLQREREPLGQQATSPAQQLYVRAGVRRCRRCRSRSGTAQRCAETWQTATKQRRFCGLVAPSPCTCHRRPPGCCSWCHCKLLLCGTCAGATTCVTCAKAPCSLLLRRLPGLPGLAATCRPPLRGAGLRRGRLAAALGVRTATLGGLCWRRRARRRPASPSAVCRLESRAPSWGRSALRLVACGAGMVAGRVQRRRRPVNAARRSLTCHSSCAMRRLPARLCPTPAALLRGLLRGALPPLHFQAAGLRPLKHAVHD